MARKAKLDLERCKGCYYCIDVCRPGAIKRTGKSNKMGYDYVVIDYDACIGCGACYTVCPDSCVTIFEEEGKDE